MCNCECFKDIAIEVFDPITKQKWLTKTTVSVIFKIINYVNLMLYDILGNSENSLEFQNKSFENFVKMLYDEKQTKEIMDTYLTVSQKIGFMNFIAPYFLDIAIKYSQKCCCKNDKPINTNGSVIIKNNKLLLLNTFFRR